MKTSHLNSQNEVPYFSRFSMSVCFTYFCSPNLIPNASCQMPMICLT